MARSTLAAFLAYVEQMLVPTLRPAISSSWTTRPPRAPAIRALIRAAGANFLFLRPTPRPHPDRTVLRQAQDAPAQARRAHRGRPPGADRPLLDAFTPANAPTTPETQDMLQPRRYSCSSQLGPIVLDIPHSLRHRPAHQHILIRRLHQRSRGVGPALQPQIPTCPAPG